MGKVIWSHHSKGWLKEIHDYIAKDNPEAARRTVDGIVERAKVLASFPEVGQPYPKQPGRGIRVLLYGHYRIAYLITKERDIRVLGVYHGALDITRFLG